MPFEADYNNLWFKDVILNISLIFPIMLVYFETYIVVPIRPAFYIRFLSTPSSFTKLEGSRGQGSCVWKRMSSCLTNCFPFPSIFLNTVFPSLHYSWFITITLSSSQWYIGKVSFWGLSHNTSTIDQQSLTWRMRKNIYCGMGRKWELLLTFYI